MKNPKILASFLVLLLSGCAWLAPGYKRPALDMPENGRRQSQAPEKKKL